MSSQWHPHIISKPSATSETCSQLKVYLPLWCLTIALLSMEMTSRSSHESSTSCTLHHHLTSTNPMVSLRWWWRKSSMPIRKQMDLPMLLLEYYCSYETHPSWQIYPLQLRYYMEDQHKDQSFQDHWNGSTYNRSSRNWSKFRTNRKNGLAGHTEQKTYKCSRSKNKYSSSPTSKGQQTPPPWLTGTVTKLLNCGCSYMIQGPNGRVYSRNRAHLKPISYDCSSFQDHPAKREGKKPEIDSFQDPKPTKVKIVSFKMDTSYVDGRSMFFDEVDTLHTSPSPPLPSPHWLYSPKSPLHSPPAHSSSRESSVEPHSEDSSPRGRKRHKSEPAFIWPQDIDRGLTPRLSALLQETSPLAPYKWERSAKARARQVFSTMHWLLSRSLWGKV